MKNKLLLLAKQRWQQQRASIESMKEKMSNLARIHIFTRRHVSYFWVYLITGLITFTSVAVYLAPNGISQSSYKTSWIGNTFGGGDKWVQNHISAMYIAPNGAVYTNSEWDEAGREAGIYKDGDVIGQAEDLHGWGRTGGLAVTANNKYLFVGMIQGNEDGVLTGAGYPAKGKDWHCVRRYFLDGKPAPFSGRFGDGSMVIVSTSSHVTGLATVGRELYVSDPGADRIRVYDTETMRQLRHWSFTRPRQIAVDRQGNFWIIQAKDANNPPKILHYSKGGKQLPKQITGVVDPSAIAVDNQGRLLIADNGLRQQVLIYNITGNPRLVGTFGTQGGIYSGTPGEVGNLKFFGITGVGVDAAGNIYVSNTGFKNSGTDLRKFSPTGTLQWQLLGLQFLDSADVDPATQGKDVFTKEEHFVIDYRKGSGQEWTYKAYTFDPFRYPDDPRLHTLLTSAFVRRIRGKRFLYLTDQYATHLFIYRFDGNIAVPSAIFAREKSDWPLNQPAQGSWLWRDKNGDGSIQRNEYERLGADDGSIWGWEVDNKGDIWQASESGIRRFRILGLDTHGSPVYSSAASQTMPIPAPFTQLQRIKYFPSTDVMYLGGYTNDRPNHHDDSGVVGTEIVRYDNWSTTKTVRWRITLPYVRDDDNQTNAIMKAMDVAGNRVFAVTVRQAEVYVYDATTGARVTTLKPGSEVQNESGWVDTPYGLRAYQRNTGEYVVFVEEVWKGKVMMYRLAASA